MLSRDVLRVELEIRILDRPSFLLRADGTDSEGARLTRILSRVMRVSSEPRDSTPSAAEMREVRRIHPVLISSPSFTYKNFGKLFPGWNRVGIILVRRRFVYISVLIKVT